MSAWLLGYTLRRQITIDHTRVGGATFTNFPVLVRLTTANFDFAQSLPNGHDIRFCYSPDTEILTENGWKPLEVIVENKEKIRVATLNPETDNLEYNYPTDYQKIYFQGKLIHQRGQSVDLLVTPEHRMWIRKEWDRRKGRKFEIVAAKDLPQHYWLQVSANWEGTGKKWFVLPSAKRHNGWRGVEHIPEKEILMEDWLKFFGFWLAEGSVFNDKSSHTISIVQKDKSLLEELQTILKQYGFSSNLRKGSGNCYNLRFCNIQLYNYLNQFGKAHQKFIPKEFKDLSQNQLRILFEYMVKGDGHVRGKNIIYFTNSKQLADDVQEIALKLGYGCSFRIRKDGSIAFGKYKRKEGYCLSLTKRKTISVNGHRNGKSLVDYEGFVYDITVPNHIIYVRRNGKAVWSGNCAADGATLLDFERERHDNIAGLAEYHVRIPSVSHTAPTHFFVYQRTATTADGANPAAVWDANTMARWSLSENPAGTAPQMRDSTIGVHHGTTHGAMVAADSVEGRIGRALRFDGVNDFVDCGLIGITGNPSFTIEGWFNFKDSVGRGVMGWGNAGVALEAAGFWHGLRGTNIISAEFAGGQPAFVNTPVSTGVWHHIVYTKTPGVIRDTSRFFLNGVDLGPMDAASSVGIPNISNLPLSIGRWANYASHKWQTVDEVRISNIARSPAWIRASFESGQGTLLSVGAMETRPVVSRAGLLLQLATQ